MEEARRVQLSAVRSCRKKSIDSLLVDLPSITSLSHLKSNRLSHGQATRTTLEENCSLSLQRYCSFSFSSYSSYSSPPPHLLLVVLTSSTSFSYSSSSSCFHSSTSEHSLERNQRLALLIAVIAIHRLKAVQPAEFCFAKSA